MESRHLTVRIREWLSQNAAAAVLVILFAVIHIFSQFAGDAVYLFGNTGRIALDGEYYRWVTCLFLHNNLRHLLTNAVTLLAVSSLLDHILKNRQTVFIFLAGGILSEIAYSAVSTDPAYEIGASGGIFALLACLAACCLRFPECFRLRWYRPDVLILPVYFVFANSSVTAFLVHMFGFAAGIILGFILVLAGFVRQT
ncbi:MAG: rhomboid family intramembrane serine protease [Lachnospiraceae bacterium]|nr:rhomboid family intramembrane serine protease [Lachnospiraceae bacterium]